MTIEETHVLSEIDIASKLLMDLIIRGVKMGIPQAVMEAHARAYFTSNVGRELYRMHQPVSNLFTAFPTYKDENISE